MKARFTLTPWELGCAVRDYCRAHTGIEVSSATVETTNGVTIAYFSFQNIASEIDVNTTEFAGLVARDSLS